MQAVQIGRSLNPSRAIQIFADPEDSARRYYNYEERELPEVAQAQLNQGDITIFAPQ